MRGARPVFSQLKQCRFQSPGGILMAVILFGLLSSMRGVAATPEADSLPHYALHLTRGPLNSVLQEFAFQTGLQVARLSDEGATTSVVGPLTGRFSAGASFPPWPAWQPWRPNRCISGQASSSRKGSAPSTCAACP